VLYQVLIPLLMRSGPIEPIALRLFRMLLSDRTPSMQGLPCPLQVDGLTLWYETDRPSNTIRGLAADAYEQPIAELFAATLRPGMSVLDIGAHIGYFSLLAARQVGPAGQVWSFEPDPANRASLERNIDANGMVDRVLVVPLAVVSCGGEGELYQVANDTGSSTLYPTRRGEGERVDVTTTSLDEWAEAEGWPQIDLIKMDTEGGEGAVIAGMTGLIRRNPSVVMVLEFQADALERAAEDPMGFLGRLLDLTTGQLELLDSPGGPVSHQRGALAALVRRSRWSPLNLVIRKAYAPGISSG
jgi:FkbM family methyltransferase